MSITWLSSKRFTQKSMYKFTLYRTSVIILTPPPLHPHIHSIVKLCRKGVHKPREKRSLKRCFQIFLQRGERWRAADVCRKRVPEFSCLKVERSVSSRLEVSFGDFQQFFTAGPKSSRGLEEANFNRATQTCKNNNKKQLILTGQRKHVPIFWPIPVSQTIDWLVNNEN